MSIVLWRGMWYILYLLALFSMLLRMRIFSFQIVGKPLYSHKVEWIVRSDLSAIRRKLGYTNCFADSFMDSYLTDSYTIVNLTKGKVMFFDFDSC
jgi:hypothetical protein